MNSNGKRIISNSVILIGAEILNKAIRMVLVVFSARLLGDENYGKFAFALAFTMLFWIVADMGVHQLLVRELARKPDKVKKYLGNALVIKFFLATLSLFLIFVIINFTNKPHDVLITVYILAFSLIVNSLVELFKSVFQAFQCMKYDAFSTLVQTFFNTVLGVGVLWLGGDIRALALTYLAANLFSLSYCLWILVTRFTVLSIDVDTRLIKFQIREGLPFGINFFFSTLYTNIASVLLSFMANDRVVGWYNAAYRLVFVLIFISMATMKAVFPALSSYYKESIDRFNRLFEKTFQAMLYVGFLLATLIFLLSDKIILFLYGEEYANAALVLKLLVWAVAFIFMTNVMSFTTSSADRQRVAARIVCFGSLFNLALNLILIPRYSHIGAACATLATEAAVFLVYLVYLSIRLVRPPILRFGPKILFINLVMGIYIFSFINLNLFILGITAVIVNFIMVVVTRYFSKEEFSYFKKLVKMS